MWVSYGAPTVTQIELPDTFAAMSWQDIKDMLRLQNSRKREGLGEQISISNCHGTYARYLRARARISLQSLVVEGPGRQGAKVQEFLILRAFRAFATQPGGKHRRPKCKVIFECALSIRDGRREGWYGNMERICLCFEEGRVSYRKDTPLP